MRAVAGLAIHLLPRDKAMQLTLSRADRVDEAPIVVDVLDNPRLESEVLIGRSADCDVQIEEPFVSRHHCTVVVDLAEQSLRVRDLRSCNGTLVNGRPVDGVREVRDGDVLTVGYLPFKLHVSRGSSVWDRVDVRCREAQMTRPRQIDFGGIPDRRSGADGRAK